MQKYQDTYQKYYASKSIKTKKYEPILIQDSYSSNQIPKDEKRYVSQREEFTPKSRIPQFLRKFQLEKEPNKKTHEYCEATKSLIVSQRCHQFRQINDQKDRYLVTSNKPPWSTSESGLGKDSPHLSRKLKKPVQNLTFDAFLQMAKKQKQRDIPAYSIMFNQKNNKQYNKTQTYILQQLRQTEDTIPDHLQSSRPGPPKATDFHQVRLLGKGKNGEVYLTIHKSTGFACAMKIIKKKDINRGTPAERLIMHNQLLRQVKIQMYLSNPNLVQLYCVFADKQNIYLIQQLGIDGQLYQLMRKKSRFSEQSTAILSRQILNGIKSMHQNDIIHRDIKPQNIVLIYGIAKLCDFGWSVHCPVQLRSTLCGTPLYLSPQVLIGDEYNQKIDIWAYGTLIYQLFTGQNPFRIKNKSDLKRIVTEQLYFADNFPRRLRSFLQNVLKKNSSQRPEATQIQTHQFLRKYAELQTSQQLANM